MDSARDGYLLPKPLQVLAGWSPGRIVALSVVLSIALGAIDWITGPLFSFRIFYLVPLAARDRVVLYTDGVSESWNAAGEEFGDGRIVAAAQAGGWAGAEETQHRILDALDRFSQGAYHDDVTAVVLAVKPNGSH
jgi:hypothetical protein